MNKVEPISNSRLPFIYKAYAFWQNAMIKVPERSSLFKRPVDLSSWATRWRTRHTSSRVTVVKNGGCGEHLWGETSRDDNVVILWWLISCYQNREWLSQMNVKRAVSILQGVNAFHLNQQHLVTLDPEIDGCCNSNIWYSEPVSFACKSKYGTWSKDVSLLLYSKPHKQMVLYLYWVATLINCKCIPIWSAAIDDQSVGEGKIIPTI